MLQFRLRTLFILTAAVALVAWTFFAPPQWLGALVICLCYCLLPAAIVSGIFYHRGYWQAFFIGAASWVGLNWAWSLLGVPISLGTQSLFWPSAMELLSEDSFSQLFSTDPDYLIYQKLQLAVPIAITIGNGMVAVGVRWWALRTALHSDRKA